MNAEAKRPLNLRLPPHEKPEVRVERAARESQQISRFIHLLSLYLVAPTDDRLASYVGELTAYREDWIRRKSGEPK